MGGSSDERCLPTLLKVVLLDALLVLQPPKPLKLYVETQCRQGQGLGFRGLSVLGSRALEAVWFRRLGGRSTQAPRGTGRTNGAALRLWRHRNEHIADREAEAWAAVFLEG